MWSWALAALLTSQVVVTAEQHLNRARTCYVDLDFPCAERSLVEARQALKNLSPELAEEALRLSAEVALSEGRNTQAREHLVALLVRAPRFRPRAGAWPPPWVKVLDEALDKVPDQSPPKITLVGLPKQVALGAPLLVRAKIEDATGVDRAELLGFGSGLTMTSTGGALYTAIIGPEQLQPPTVRIAVEATDVYGRRQKTPETSIVVSNTTPAPPSEESGGPGWWVFAVAGAVVAGAVVVALVATSGEDLSPVQGKISWP